jgi:PIN domain nuclease of toxin-antitoxin system
MNREFPAAFIHQTIAAGDHIGVSAISLAEMVYLIEKSRIPANALVDLHAAIADPKSMLQHMPLDEALAMKMPEVSRQDIPDLPDRVIAATARLHGVPLLSRDGRMRSSSVATIWYSTSYLRIGGSFSAPSPPETERLTREEIRNGHLHSVDEIILAGVEARREKHTPPTAEARPDAAEP